MTFTTASRLRRPLLLRPLLPLAAAPLIALATALPASAQMADTNPRYSFLPYTSNGYVGINLGTPNYGSSCGITDLFSCDDADTGVRIYAGGLFNNWLGMELGYLDLGKAERAGGDTRARGLNFSLVARAPVANTMSVFGKVGTTYGRTEVTADAASGIPSGKESDWGLSYGVGASFDFSRNWSAVVEWERHNFRFAGGEREPVKMTSLGLKYRF
jgi:opacity protein-like surface antigen